MDRQAEAQPDRVARAGLVAQPGQRSKHQTTGRSGDGAAPEAGGRVRILQFYASTGIVAAGEKARLCYSVENAKSVRISPMMQEVYPFPNHCLEIEPEHTTHYTLLAEGYDGAVATKSFTLQVEAEETPPPQVVNYAGL